MMSGLVISVVWGSTIAGLVAQSQPVPASSQPTTGVMLDLRVSRFADMHFHVRTFVAGVPDANVPAALRDAVSAARAVEQALGGQTSWGLIEGSLLRAESAAEAVEICRALPESHTDRAGRPINVRPAAQRLADTYVQLEPEFLRGVWPRHSAAIDAAKVRLTTELIPRQSACFAHAAKSLGMEMPELTVPVYLVADAPFPRGFTHRRPGTGAVCVVGVRGVEGSLLWEVVVHEAIHAMDVATEKQDTALQVLRRDLRKLEPAPDPAVLRDVPHTLIFVQAAETIRRVLDPAHRDYGEVTGYYNKVPLAAKAVRTTWGGYLAGDLPRATALELIVAAVRGAPPPATAR